MFAVVKQIVFDFENPFFVNDKPKHLLRIAGECESYTIVEVDCVLEKILYLSSNPNQICVARAPNFCGHCR